MSALEAKAQAGSTVMSALLAATGFVAPWPEVVAGYLFAIAGGFAGAAASPPTERLGLSLTIFVALVIGTFAGIAHPYFVGAPLGLSAIAELPIQLVMGVSGLGSRMIARRIATGDFSLPWKKKGPQL